MKPVTIEMPATIKAIILICSAEKLKLAFVTIITDKQSKKTKIKSFSFPE